MVTMTAPRRASDVPSYAATPPDPKTRPPPWIQTMTGFADFDWPAGAQTFK